MSLKDQVAAIMNDWGWTSIAGDAAMKLDKHGVITRGDTDEWAADVQRAIALALGSDLAEKINQEALANLRRREGISDGTISKGANRKSGVRKGSKRKSRRATEDQAIPTSAAGGD